MSNINNLDKLLDGGVEVVSVGSNKKGLFASMIVATALAIGAGGLYIHNQDNSTSTNSPGVLSSITTQIKNTIKIEDAKIKNPIYGNYIADPDLKAKIEKASNFDLPSDMKPNQVSRYVAQTMFKRGDYMGYASSLISEREGFKSSLYNDVGWFAMGNGFNLGVQSKQHIKDILGSISTDQDYINQLSNLAGKHVNEVVPSNFKQLTISPQRSMQVAMIMVSNDFEKSLINSFSKELKANEKGVQAFNLLKDNEKGGLVNIPYQKGRLSNSETKQIVSYALDPNKTPEKALAAANSVNISYMLNGKRVEDIRAMTLFKLMFTNPPLYEKAISNTLTPKDISQNDSIFKGNITSTGDKVIINDPIGDAKAQAEKEGKILNLKVAPDNDITSMRPKTKTSSYYNVGV